MTKGLALCLLVLFSVLQGIPALASNDPLFPQQWGLAKIQAEPAWGSSRGNGIKVAVLDTGVDFLHEDLAGKDGGSYNCIKGVEVEQPCDPAPAGDDNGHGTQVAGIIGAVQGNGKGVASVAPGSTIMSFKALGGDGSGALSDVIRGIRSAADHGARVINLSLGPEVNLINDLLNLLLGGNPKEEFREAFKYAADKGALIVAAAGNSGTASFFTGLENVLVVGATGRNDEVAFYSSSGAEIFAPGGNSPGQCNAERCINTTSPGGYKAVQGTSFAAPFVSGVAALTLAQGLGAPEARARINATADPIQDGKRVNALRAVGGAPLALVPPPPPPAAVPGPGVRPPAPSRPMVPVPLPSPVQNILPILVLSNSEPEESPPPRRVAAPSPHPSGPAWTEVAAIVLASATAAGQGLFQLLRLRGG